MKKLNSDLFNKLKDNEISKNTKLIMGGEEPPESSSRTGDNDCTHVGGADCTDNATSFLADANKTATDSDGCSGRI